MESSLIYSSLPWFSYASFHCPPVQQQVYQRLRKFFIPSMCVNTPVPTLSRVRINVQHNSQPNKHVDVFSSSACLINALILSSEGNSFAERVEAPKRMESNHDTRFAVRRRRGGVIRLNSNLGNGAHRSRHKLEYLARTKFCACNSECKPLLPSLFFAAQITYRMPFK